MNGPASNPPRQVRGGRVPFNILIVDDNLSIRKILRAYLECNPEWKVCGEAENGQVAVQRVKELSPDVVILDWQMPLMNGLEAARQITRIAPGIAMMMFTMYCYHSLSEEAKAAGIRQVFSKSDGPALLIASLNSLFSGRQTDFHLGQAS
jgi:DNA-binding NarL/FixJ family response regulator